MKKLLFIFISIIVLSTPIYAVVKSKGDAQYTKERKSQFVERSDWDKWVKKMQKWFDKDSDKELMQKVASRSEVHGYVRKEKEEN